MVREVCKFFSNEYGVWENVQLDLILKIYNFSNKQTKKEG